MRLSPFAAIVVIIGLQATVAWTDRTADSPAPENATVTFAPDEPDLTLLRSAGRVTTDHVYEFRSVIYYELGRSDVRYVPLVTGPGVEFLPVGHYAFAVAKDGRERIAVGTKRIDGPVTIHASYSDRRAIRILGDLLIVAGIVGGIALVVPATAGNKVDTGQLWGGIGTFVGTVGFGALLGFLPDTAHVTIEPTAAVAPPQVGPLVSGQTRGAAVTVRF